MKKLTILGSLFISVLLTNCNSETKQGFKASKNDTVKTVALFVLGNTNELRLDYAFKIRTDLKVPVVVDSSGGTVTSKETWVRDSIYLIPIADTVRGADNKPKPDSLGRFNVEVKWYNINKNFILKDFGVDMKEVAKYMGS